MQEYVNRAGDMACASLCGSRVRKEPTVSEVVYTSRVVIERVKGPLRIARLPGEAQPVAFSAHGAIAAHYKVDPASLGESHAATLDYVVAATAG
jgi:hypothetical protein